MLFSENGDLADKILSTLLDQLRRDRDGLFIDRMQLRSAISFLIEVNVVQVPQQSPTYS
jgi:hypothetical protein